MRNRVLGWTVEKSCSSTFNITLHGRQHRNISINNLVNVYHDRYTYKVKKRVIGLQRKATAVQAIRDKADGECRRITRALKMMEGDMFIYK